MGMGAHTSVAREEEARSIANRCLENRGVTPPLRTSNPLRQAQQQPGSTSTTARPTPVAVQPPASVTRRTIFVVDNDIFRDVPQDVRDVAVAELTDAWSFVARLDKKHPITIDVRKPALFPHSMAFSDAVVAIEPTEADVTAHLSQATRLQFSNAQESLRRLNVNFQPPAAGHSTTQFEADGRADMNKQVIVAGRRSFALPIMSSAVAFEQVRDDIVDELTSQTKNAN